MVVPRWRRYELPNFIPKRSQVLPRAVIAENAGKRLAAVFYLRCFIEQVARRQTGMPCERTKDRRSDTWMRIRNGYRRTSALSLTFVEGLVRQIERTSTCGR